jgi:hypothetical protein
MAITVKHNKVSTIPDTDDTSLVRPSDWNADHTLVGTIDVANGGTGASTLTGYVKGNGTSAMTAVATVPSTDITGLGTMSTQNANAVAITGGTINGTTIGATTPSTVNATTITGQTGVLRGTGSNLIGYSQAFDDAVWTKSNSSITANSTAAPDGTTTADTLVENTANNTHYVYASANANLFATIVTGATYTASIFAKPAGRNRIRFSGDGSSAFLGGDVLFDVSAGTVVGSLPSGVTSASIVSAGNGWYRCIIVSVATGTVARPIVFLDNGTTTSYTGDGTSGVFLWGVQLEFGSTANSYVATTPTRVYGTPTLSFSGVSTIGLQSDGSLYVSPAGTGAIQAQATTSTTAGGNARGANAVDWQTIRSAASQVSSGGQSAIVGGQGNTASGFANVVGGYLNNATGYANSILGGQQNTTGGNFGAVVNGFTNTANNYSVVINGQSNTAAGYYNFIGGGFTNSATSSSAVTTQSGTMNATTAVTLSGSNANIKVGQYITGTSISGDTYVAAISGTALTLSKVASGSSTSTLSFFTPHGVVVGGGNNQATGSYSFIGGGGDAGTAGNRNTASGAWSTVVGGWQCRATGEASFVGGGGSYGGGVSGNLASGTSAFVGAGYANTAGGYASTTVGGSSNSTINNYSFCGGGGNNSSNANYSAIMGGSYGTARSIEGNQVFPACVSPIANSAGVSQAALLILGVQTTDATATVLRSTTSAAGTTNQVILPNNSAYFFTGEVVSGVTGGGDTKGWTIEGVIKRGANAAATTLVGVTVMSSYADLGAATWTIGVTADTTNGGLKVTFTGQASTTIRTVCSIRTCEMTY